jgi:Peptidase family M28
MRLLCSTLGISIISAGYFGTSYSFGHGEQIQLKHFVSHNQTVYISLISSEQSPSAFLSRWVLPENKEIVVTKIPVGNALKQKSFNWVPGVILAGVEIQKNFEQQINFQKEDILFSTPTWNVVTLTPKKALDVSKNPFIYLDLVDTTEQEVKKISQVQKTYRNLKSDLAIKNLAVTLEPNVTRVAQVIKELSGEEAVDIGDKNTTITERGSKNGRISTQQYLKQKFEDVGISTELKCYKGFMSEGCNVEGTLVGKNPNKVILVSAHIDSVNNKGADDDASGAAALVEIATLTAGLKPENSIRFVGFDQEEIGLVGSKAYAKNLSQKDKESIIAVFQMDMIGFDSNKDGAFHAMSCGRADSVSLTKEMNKQILQMNIPLKYVDACTNRSDHASFWKQNIPAIIVSENFFGNSKIKKDGNSCYHQKCDSIELVDMNYTGSIVKAVANSVWYFANTINP